MSKMNMAAKLWLDWYDTLISEPRSANPSWSSERMEYGFSVGARMASGEKVLTAPLVLRAYGRLTYLLGG